MRRTPVEAIYPRLALSAILWWNEEKDEAIAELTKVVDAWRPESDLRFDLAELVDAASIPGGCDRDCSTRFSRSTT